MINMAHMQTSLCGTESALLQNQTQEWREKGREKVVEKQTLSVLSQYLPIICFVNSLIYHSLTSSLLTSFLEVSRETLFSVASRPGSLLCKHNTDHLVTLQCCARNPWVSAFVSMVV